MSIKNILLNLDEKELKDRKHAERDFLFYLGECRNKTMGLLDDDFLGQSWITFDNLDYTPSQIIDNKVKPLINKQARFMFGKEPTIILKAYEKEHKESCEELRQYIDSILNASKFWSNTLKAFKIATITKRVLLRLEAEPNQPIRLFYHSIDDFKYQVDSNDITKLKSVIFVRFDASTRKEVTANQIWYRYTYYMKESSVNNQESCFLRVEKFKGDNLSKPIEVKESDIKLSKIPCWVIVNEQSITNITGISDIEDLKPLQDTYNKRLSDFNDSLKFLMFGQTVVVDATEETVNACKIAPNALMALKTLEEGSEKGKQAQAYRVESSFSNADPVDSFFKRLEDSMYEKLAIPRPEQLQNIPSAKALKYLYTELIARCSEKWNDWEPAIRSMLRLIVEACSKFNCYDDWNHDWDDLMFSIVLNKNYPIPEDEEDSKRLALEEVNNNVRSHRNYIKEFGDDEDYEEAFNEVLEDNEKIQSVEQDQFRKDAEIEIDNIDEELNNESDNSGK